MVFMTLSRSREPGSRDSYEWQQCGQNQTSFRGDHLDRFRPELDLRCFKSPEVGRSHGSSVNGVPQSSPNLEPVLVHILVHDFEEFVT